MLFDLLKKKPVKKEPADYNKNIIQRGNEYVSSSSMLLDKKIIGDFFCLEELVIDNNANVTGNVNTIQCIIKGKITGDVLCLRNIIIKSTAVIEGEITAETVEVESGAVINGCITLQRNLQAPHLIQKVKEYESLYNKSKIPVLSSTELPVVADDKKELTASPVAANSDTIGTDMIRPAEPLNTNASKNTLLNNSAGKWW